MAQTSGTQALQGRKVNHDPAPYLWRDGSRTARGSVWGSRPACRYAPRPEFDVPDNPILARFRKWRGMEPQDIRWVEVWLAGFDAYDAFGGFKGWEIWDSALMVLVTSTDEQRAFARRVLEKLPLLAEVEVVE